MILLGMPAPSPGSPVQAARTSVAERAARIRFRRALSLMVMTLVAPGSAQLAAGGNRRIGLVALRTWVAMWLVVLVKLVTPPLFVWPWGIPNPAD